MADEEGAKCALCWDPFDEGLPAVRPPCNCKTLLYHADCMIEMYWMKGICSTCKKLLKVSDNTTFLAAYYLQHKKEIPALLKRTPAGDFPDRMRFSPEIYLFQLTRHINERFRDTHEQLSTEGKGNIFFEKFPIKKTDPQVILRVRHTIRDEVAVKYEWDAERRLFSRREHFLRISVKFVDTEVKPGEKCSLCFGDFDKDKMIATKPPCKCGKEGLRYHPDCLIDVYSKNGQCRNCFQWLTDINIATLVWTYYIQRNDTLFTRDLDTSDVNPDDPENGLVKIMSLICHMFELRPQAVEDKFNEAIHRISLNRRLSLKVYHRDKRIGYRKLSVAKEKRIISWSQDYMECSIRFIR